MFFFPEASFFPPLRATRLGFLLCGVVELKATPIYKHFVPTALWFDDRLGSRKANGSLF